METQGGPHVHAAIERLRLAINRHDLDALEACFASEYQSEFPAHPDRAFQGHDQVRKNWARIFAAVPDMEAVLRGWIADGETVWAEWEWRGTRIDGAPHLMRGVTVQGVRKDQITWARLYMEPVEQDGAGIDAAVRGHVGEGRIR